MGRAYGRKNLWTELLNFGNLDVNNYLFCCPLDVFRECANKVIASIIILREEGTKKIFLKLGQTTRSLIHNEVYYSNLSDLQKKVLKSCCFKLVVCPSGSKVAYVCNVYVQMCLSLI